jgi:regulation of enolase protein 1 (concanavalin A-like superfamily)
MRPLALLLGCSLAAWAALAAPVPKAADRGAFASSPWGKPIDPDKGSKFSFGKSSLTIEVPGKDRDLWPRRDRMNAPRLLRDAEGNFAAEVRVTGDFDADEALPGVVKRPVLAAGGLVVINSRDENHCVRWLIGAAREGKASKPRASFAVLSQYSPPSIRSYGEGSSNWPLGRRLRQAYLRVEVEHGETFGTQVRHLISADGKEWVNLMPRTREHTPLSKKLKVGVVAVANVKAPLKVTLDRFKLTPLKPKSP